jgi:CRP-like cAMP-binding protein
MVAPYFISENMGKNLVLTKAGNKDKIFMYCHYITKKEGENMEDDFSKLRATLQKVDFFYSLNFGELDHLIKVLKKRKVAQGTTIIKQGEKGDAFFLISSGAVSVYIKKGMMGSQKKVADLEGGDFFGEMALVSDMPRNATVIADAPAELFVLYKSDFKKILLANPKISGIITEVLAKRKQSNK